MSKVTTPKKTDKLSRIVELANSLIAAKKTVDELEDRLDAAKKVQRGIETEHLPELMRELELTSVVLDNGMKVTLSDEIDCGITAANHAAAMRWLDENSFGGIIKTKLQAAFNRDDRLEAMNISALVRDAIKDRGIEASCEVGEAVHPSTLKSFLKEELAKGTPVPFDLFSIHPYSKAKIKQA